ncbi:hypothetical protein FNV43_RR05102 [Rhamnella rubrinervis]|uniref:non-specific serine/threonine protein kinase n=1 Tax=Rhamnella rubrinervis TaxID=2594499 RepID=A0A8K0MQR8_9ROSA|nr:hypothetical protein FNV43_RR05102 [Rhamnella rubrinervis]
MGINLKEPYFLIILCVSVFHFSLAQDENQFIYNGFHGANLHLDGIAKVHPNGLLQLTNISKQSLGHAFYRSPLSFSTSSSGSISRLSFSTSFVFAIVPESPNLGGHGLAFTISPSMNFSQAVLSQYLGLFNSSNDGLSANHVLAVELDTISSPEFKDIDDNHVGVDVNSLKSVESAPTTYFSSEEMKNISLELISGNPMQLWIDYDEAQQTLNVTVAPVRIPKPNRPLLSKPLDLSRIALEYMYVGFSSSTGTLASDHYILGWSFNKSGLAQNLEISKLPSLPQRKRSQKRKRYEEVCEEWESEYGPQRFSYKNLYKATKGFKERQLLGAGGFGKVYRGTLATSNEQVAVKKVSHDSKQGMKEFVAEIACMGRLRHRNLVQLLGYCRRRGELLLVYDYMPNGSLDKFLFSNENQILIGFKEWEQVVLHRDVKASNVLLDADLNGRLGDFGLARLYDHGSEPQTTRVVGTVGYLAPELARTGKATTSSDVFAFGTFLLEVACGRRPIELHRVPEEEILVDWVLECWKRGGIRDASDPKLEGNYLAEEMELVLKLGLLCSQSMPAMRPNMRQVMQYLGGNATLPDMQLDSVSIDAFTESNEAFDLVMSFPSSFGNCSVYSLSSNRSNLSKGR